MLIELILGNNNNRRVGNELCNRITFLFLLIAVGLVVVTTTENSGKSYHDKQYFLHLIIKLMVQKYELFRKLHQHLGYFNLF